MLLLKKSAVFALSNLVFFVFPILGYGTKDLVNNPQDWIGEKIIFLPRPIALQKYMYFDWGSIKKITSIPKKFGIKYEELVGKTAVVVSIQKDESYLYTTAKLDESGKLLVAQSLLHPETSDKRVHLDDVGFISEFDSAKEMIGKYFWSNRVVDISTTTIAPDDENDFYGKIPISNLERCGVFGIEWGYSNLAPIRFNFVCTGGKSGFWDGSIYADNAIGVFRPFPLAWYSKNPKLVHPEWGIGIWELIESHKIQVGMTQEMAEMSWGKPDTVNQDVGSWGVHEQWVYGGLSQI